MSRTLYDAHGLSIGLYAGPKKLAVNGELRRVQFEIHGAARGDEFGHYTDMSLSDAVAMLRQILERLEHRPEVDKHR